ncbi:MAG: LptA/OstA family protein, partial [Candidatus Binatia bacterium]
MGQPAPPGDAADNGPIEVTADKLSAEDGASKIEASGNVEITRDQMTLKADEVRVNRETQDVEAVGNVSVDAPEWQVRSAESLQFNLGSETGEGRDAKIFVEQGHISITGGRFQKFEGQA